MCGICGIVRPPTLPSPSEAEILTARDALIHRGPDDAGSYLGSGIALGVRRLAILDPSPRGHMPMSTPDGRFHLIHNGEIFNFRELRTELEGRGYRFRSDTDTEVLLCLYAQHGPALLERLHGQFAFAVWDERERTLFAARDRLGIKPFFYHHGSNGELRFASEEKALLASGLPAEVAAETLEELFLFRYVAGEQTPYRGILRLAAGSCLRWHDGNLEVKRWWNLSDRLLAMAQDQPREKSRKEAVRSFRNAFEASLEQRRIADVPLGVLLSGGLDSSSVAASLARRAPGTVDSFTVRFGDPAFDEGPWARAVVEHHGLQSHEIQVPTESLPKLLEDATWHLGQPLAHGNDVHLLAISRHAKPRVTVLLSGEGADEVLGGYDRYRPFLYPRALALAAPVLRGLASRTSLSGRLRRAERLLRPGSLPERLLWSAAAHLPGEIPGMEGQSLQTRRGLLAEGKGVYSEAVRRLMYLEQHTYLQSILDRNDRMTMGASIECRVPFLDHRLVELAARWPTCWLLTGRRTKIVLRDAMKDRLPEVVLTHRKMGFGVPWHRLLRHTPPLREWLERTPESDLLEAADIPPTWTRDVVRRFLAGDDRLTSSARQLVFMTLWYERCVRNRAGLLS